VYRNINCIAVKEENIESEVGKGFQQNKNE
jgi:hypothetical protein